MFWLVLSSAYTALGLSLSFCPWAVRLGFIKNLGGDTAGAADSNWLEEYSISYDFMVSNYQKKMCVGCLSQLLSLRD